MLVAAPEVVNFKYTHTHACEEERSEAPHSDATKNICPAGPPMANTGLFVGYPVLAGKI